MGEGMHSQDKATAAGRGRDRVAWVSAFRTLLPAGIVLAGILLTVHTAIAAGLSVPLMVKENAAAGATGYPVSVVVPLPRGLYHDPAALKIDGSASQIEALERWHGDDSLRHVLVHFQPSVAADGEATYRLVEGAWIAPRQPAAVSETDDSIEVNTGPLRFRVSKTAFNILDRVWFDRNRDGVFQAGEEVISSSPRNGGVFVPRQGAGPVQYDSDRRDLRVEVEEAGPMRVTIRVEAVTRFVTTTEHLHGFAARIYAYAGQPFIKIDYQLQNSDKQVVRSWPLYFDGLNLNFRLNLAEDRRVCFGLGDETAYTAPAGIGVRLSQEMHDRFRILDTSNGAVLYNPGRLPAGVGPDGFVDARDSRQGVQAVIRNFWQMWPNGLRLSAANGLSIQLFPVWSRQWHQGAFSRSGLYWIEDMQHVYKEVLLNFHSAAVPDEELIGLARTFQFPPTAVVPTSWYRKTQATLDLGGVIPPARTIPASSDERRPFYHTEGFNLEDWYDATGPYYGAGWMNFWDREPGYRSASCTPGGWPYSGAQMIATGNPADLFEAEAHGQAELNLRPQWMTGYSHDEDWERLQLSENPYCGGRWRIYEGHEVSKLAAPPLPNTGSEQPVYFARDDQHGWFYHMPETYFLTGNPWIRDWYRFIAEFRRVRLERLDPWPDTNSRATGHSLQQVLQAYRVTGETRLLTRFRSYLRKYLRPDQDPRYGDQKASVEPGGGGFQTGYLARAIVDYLEEVRAIGDWQAYAEGFNYLSGLMEWNYHHGNFPYYFDARSGGTGVSSGTSLTLIDPQAWYYWHTGLRTYLDQVKQYIARGLNGGERPYGEFQTWSGQFEGRYYLFAKNTTRVDATPPPAITDLRASMAAPSTLRLKWTAPTDAARYHVVWGNKAIVWEHSTSKLVTNWWAANAVGPRMTPTPGGRQTLDINVGNVARPYAAVFTFDQADNMSAMSNLASIP